jgi:hypothetical protein
MLSANCNLPALPRLQHPTRLTSGKGGGMDPLKFVVDNLYLLIYRIHTYFIQWIMVDRWHSHRISSYIILEAEVSDSRLNQHIYRGNSYLT